MVGVVVTIALGEGVTDGMVVVPVWVPVPLEKEMDVKSGVLMLLLLLLYLEDDLM